VGEGITIVVLANLAGTDTTRIVDGVAQALDPRLALLEPVAPIADHEPAVTARVRTLLEQAALGKLPHDQFSTSIGDFPEVSKQATKDLQAVGPIQRLDLLQRRDYGDDRPYAVVGAIDARRLSFGLAPDARSRCSSWYEYLTAAVGTGSVPESAVGPRSTGGVVVSYRTERWRLITRPAGVFPGRRSHYHLGRGPREPCMSASTADGTSQPWRRWATGCCRSSTRCATRTRSTGARNRIAGW
jgi:hypothetical protein